MNPLITDIGRPFIRGERVEINNSKMNLLIDSNCPMEVLLLDVDPKGESEIIGVNPDGPYFLEKHGPAVKINLDLTSLHANHKLILAVYAKHGVCGDILMTVDNPRGHIALRGDDSAGIVLAEIYSRNDSWRLKIYGGSYKEGLPAILTAYES